MSFPEPPSSVFAPLFPTKALFNELPVPLMLAVPVSVRFSTLLPQACCDELGARRPA